MASKQSFADILETFLKENHQSPQGPTAAAPFEKNHPNLWTSSVLYPFARKVIPPTKNPYPRVRRTPKRPQPPPAAAEDISIPMPPKGYPFYKLSPEGQEAFRQLHRLGAILSKDDISTLKLKREYRRLAKQYHPDHNPGTTEKFLNLKAQEAKLGEAIKNIMASL